MTQWVSRIVGPKEVGTTLNDLTTEGWHCWPQCIQVIQNMDLVLIVGSQEDFMDLYNNPQEEDDETRQV